MKKGFFLSSLTIICLLLIASFAFSSKDAPLSSPAGIAKIAPKVKAGCTNITPTCAQAQSYLWATYNATCSDPTKRYCIIATVNGINDGHCYQCPTGTYDHCLLRQYAITNFPSLHLVMSDFKSACGQ